MRQPETGPTRGPASRDVIFGGTTIKIGIFGHYGNLNLGDEAIIEASIQNIRRLRPDASIELFSVNPVDTASRYGLPAHPVSRIVSSLAVAADPDKSAHPTSTNGTSRPQAASSVRALLKRMPGAARAARAVRALVLLPARALKEWQFLTRSFRILRTVDLLIVAGSNQFLDNFGGPFHFPFTLFKWSWLARLTHTKLAFVSVGAGPLDSPLGKWFIRRAIAGASYLSFRDEASRELVQGRRPTGQVYPDLAFSLEWSGAARAKAADRLVVAINPMPVYDSRYWCDKDDHRYENYVGRLAAFCSRVINEGHELFLFGTQAKDENAIDDLLAACARNDIGRRTARSVKELLDVIAEADIVVPVRFHGTVLSLLAARGVLGICYYRKAADLLDDMGQRGFHVAVDDFDPDDLYDRFRRLRQGLEQQQHRISRRNADYAAMLQTQYEAVLKLVDA